MRVSSSRRTCSEATSATAASAGSAQVLSESPPTATASTGRAGSAAVPVSSSVVSASSSSTCRAVRTRAAPAGVGRTGRLRTSSTCPVADSRARSRWLTADGVTCSTRAAESRLP